MKYREYERRRHALEEQFQADLDLIRAGHQAKLRALEMVWLASAEADGPGSAQDETSPSETVPSETVPSETPASETQASETPRSETPGEAPMHRPRRGDVLSDLLDALPNLPEVFEKKDIFQALGYVPPRATLYRAISTLRAENKIAIAQYSEGGTRTRYRKLGES